MDETPDDPPARESSRRRFLARLGGFFGLAVAAPRLRTAEDGPSRIGRSGHSAPASGAGAAPTLPPVFDLHAHPGLFAAEGTPLYPGDGAGPATVEEGLESGLAAAFFSLVGDLKILEIDPRTGPRPTRPHEPGEAWQEYRRQMRVVRALLARTPTSLATDAGQVSADPDRSTVAALLALEGGDALGARPDRLETMYDDGIRSVQLVHYAPNDLGDLQTAPARFGGLSQAGREVVAGMNRLGMMVDVAHASFETTVDAAGVSDDPLILSHSHLKTGGEDPMQPRLITPEHARVVADTGGVIGMWPAGPPNGDMAGFVENTLRLIDVVGTEHVGLGTDMDGGPGPVLSRYRQLEVWADGLRRAGLTDAELAAVLGGNALRVAEGVLGA